MKIRSWFFLLVALVAIAEVLFLTFSKGFASKYGTYMHGLNVGLMLYGFIFGPFRQRKRGL